MAERVAEPVMSLFDIDRFREVVLLAGEMEEPVESENSLTHPSIDKIWPH
jgi:hypothetical protein